ncbi:hypothetical protein D3C77_192720 [compost metagenome]
MWRSGNEKIQRLDRAASAGTVETFGGGKRQNLKFAVSSAERPGATVANKPTWEAS